MSRAAPGGVAKRSVMIAGHRTSVSLEPEFWEALRAVAATEGRSVQALIGTIDAERGARNLSSAIRVFVLHRCRDMLSVRDPDTTSQGAREPVDSKAAD